MMKPPTDKTSLPEFFRQLSEALPELFGNIITVTMAANLLPQKFPHGLGRPYRGAVLLFTGFGEIRVMEPALQDDSDVNVTLEDSVAAGQRVMLRVF